MLWTALRPRWLALLAIALLAAAGMGWLGHWQWDRAKVHGEAQATKAPSLSTAKPVEQVLPARQTFPKDGQDAPVTATGTWDGAHQLAVPGREQDGRTGYWLLVPLKLSDGSAVGVVRGWVASLTEPGAKAPSGSVTVTGYLEPTEAPPDLAPGQTSGLPAGQIENIAITDLVNQWPYSSLITGYVLAQQETGSDTVAPQHVPLATKGAGLDWLNVGYAIQWWLFAAFTLFMWGRLVRDEHQQQGAAVSGPSNVSQDERTEPLARGVTS